MAKKHTSKPIQKPSLPIIEFDPKNYLVTRSNALVETARMRFSAMQQRIIHTALTQIKKGAALTDQVMYAVPISTIADLADQAASGTFYRRTKAAARTLLTSLITIKTAPNGDELAEILVCPIIQSYQYNDAAGTLSIRFCCDAIPYLSGLDAGKFTQCSVQGGLLEMDSAYAYRLHDLVARWGDFGTREIAIDDFRWMMGLKDGQYARFNNLRPRVIEPAISDINAHSQYEVTVGYRRRRRRVVALQFAFRLKSEAAATKPRVRLGRATRAQLEAEARPGESWAEVEQRLAGAQRNTRANSSAEAAAGRT